VNSLVERLVGAGVEDGIGGWYELLLGEGDAREFVGTQAEGRRLPTDPAAPVPG
jgi:hypothetical protein